MMKSSFALAVLSLTVFGCSSGSQVFKDSSSTKGMQMVEATCAKMPTAQQTECAELTENYFDELAVGVCNESLKTSPDRLSCYRAIAGLQFDESSAKSCAGESEAPALSACLKAAGQ